MARKAFYSFHFKNDHWRAATVRRIGSIEGNAELSDNDWESLKGRGDPAVEKWITDQMSGKSCVILLVGAETAGRPWINYEIRKAWELGKGLVGVRIHKILNASSQPSRRGADPFAGFNVGGKALSSIVTLYDPPGDDSKEAYKSISDNIGDLCEKAIAIRAKY